ncbi:MAG: MetQ/NlpA family ABC transporter substrate-binding protein [Syntrophomonadaceae bacterium]|nr:MetQ/NlpA family ABC transporter substrate-binding protein [Syntrophomonadaceae bacterium]MDD3023022.1 MetQ/NlpA family ABC transporter substrate-binding protein [Syntrophomonadaceae bacterium]
MKRLIICTVLIISSFVFLGCSKEQKTESPVPQNTITIGVMPDVESIPFIIAEKNGYFDKEGVEVEIQHFKSAKDRDSALQSGKLDGVITDILAVVFANEGGIQLRICAKNDGNVKLLAGKDSSINSMNDLKGKNIGLSSHTIMEYTTDKMLEAGGLKAGDINKIAIPLLPTRLEMLQGGRVDAAILPEPLAGLAVKNGAKVLSSTDDLKNKAGAIAFTAKSLQESSDEIKAVFKAYNEAVIYLQNEPSANYIDFIIEAQGFPPAIRDTLILPQYTAAELPSEKVFNDVVQWLQANQLIKADYEYKALVDDQVLR